MKTRITLLTALITAFLSFNAMACGDSLYRVGKGVAYRTYSAPLPGNLLVYATSEHEKLIAEELANSGHGVYMVADAEEFATALEQGGYDVVIAPFSERAMIESTSVTIKNAEASFLPVAQNGDEKKLAKQSYGTAVETNDNIKRYLKSIHRELKKRA